MLYLRQRVLQRAVVGRGVAESLAADLVELLEGANASGYLRGGGFVPGLGRGGERLVELLGRELAVVDGLLARLQPLGVTVGIRLAPDDARLFVAIEVVARLR